MNNVQKDNDAQRQHSLRDALKRGAILSKAPEHPAPVKDERSAVTRFLEHREIKKYDKETERVTRYMEADTPASVQKRNDERAKCMAALEEDVQNKLKNLENHENDRW